MIKDLILKILSLLLSFITLVSSTVNASENIEYENEEAEPEMIAEPLDILPGNHMETYTDAETGEYLDYWLFVPEGATTNMPLIIFLHGDGEVNELMTLQNFAMIKQAKEFYGENFPFIAISPCTRTYSWIKGNIPITLKGLIDSVIDTCSIDIDRVIITGHSRGAIGVWHMIDMYSGFFAAAVPVSCDSESPITVANCVNTPIWGFVGGGDYYDYGINMQNLAAQINKLGGNARITVLDSCTHGGTKDAAYTIETFEWMLAQTRIKDDGI